MILFAAHSSTSLSSALGIVEANKLSNKSDNVIAIGDGYKLQVAYDHE